MFVTILTAAAIASASTGGVADTTFGNFGPGVAPATVAVVSETPTECHVVIQDNVKVTYCVNDPWKYKTRSVPALAVDDTHEGLPWKYRNRSLPALTTSPFYIA